MKTRTKTLRRRQARLDMECRLDATTAFLAVWASLLASLPSDYSCYMTCNEAETAADLLRAFGEPGVAEWLLADHAEGDECGEAHHDEAACPSCALGLAS